MLLLQMVLAGLLVLVVRLRREMLAQMVRLLLLLLQTLLVVLLLLLLLLLVVLVLLLLLLLLLLELNLLLVEVKRRMRLRQGETERLVKSDGLFQSRVRVAADRAAGRVDSAARSRCRSGRQSQDGFNSGRLEATSHGGFFGRQRRAGRVVFHIDGPVASLLLHSVVERHGTLAGMLDHTAQTRRVLLGQAHGARLRIAGTPADGARQPVVVHDTTTTTLLLGRSSRRSSSWTRSRRCGCRTGSSAG